MLSFYVKLVFYNTFGLRKLAFQDYFFVETLVKLKFIPNFASVKAK